MCYASRGEHLIDKLCPCAGLNSGTAAVELAAASAVVAVCGVWKSASNISAPMPMLS